MVLQNALKQLVVNQQDTHSIIDTRKKQTTATFQIDIQNRGQ